MKPKVVQHDAQEDIQNIGDIDQMYQKFVVRIDRFRSISDSPRTGGAQSYENSGGNLAGLNIDSERFVESRAHAFYRMIGLPVAVKSGYYYNPGHDPKQNNTMIHRINVNNALNNGNPEIVRLSQLRETQFKERRIVFQNQNDVSITYAALMRNTKPFLMAKTGQEPFYEDLQTQPIAGRDTDLNNLNIVRLLVPLFIYKNVSHILKPFVVNPEIEMAVTTNFKRRICVPFLPDVESTKSTPDDVLKRPILEYIIKQRLKNTEVDTVFIQSAARLLQNSSEATDSDTKTTLLALSGQDSLAAVDGEIIDTIQGFTSVQSSTINMFTKAIRSSIAALDQAVRDFDKIRATYNVQILSDIDGPEYEGGKVVTLGGIDVASKEQQRIALMQLTELVSRRKSQLQEQFIGDESVYATAVVADVARNFTPDVSKQERELSEYGRQAIKHLRTIEIITGEVSGLGLVDILAIYTALWAIDIEYLIGFLDDTALTRLKENFPELINSEIRSQINGTRPGIIKTLQEFEKLLFNILTYADKVLVQGRQTPRLARKGSIT